VGEPYIDVLAIDPDPCGGTWVHLDGTGVVREHHRREEIDALCDLARFGHCVVAVELMQSYGMPVGLSIFESCYRIGELMRACKGNGVTFWPTTRKQVVSTLCGKANAKDKNVRAALLDLYPATGGGKTPQIGTKAQPGPLYGLAADEWSALAIGLCYLYSVKQGPLWARDSL